MTVCGSETVSRTSTTVIVIKVVVAVVVRVVLALPLSGDLLTTINTILAITVERKRMISVYY